MSALTPLDRWIQRCLRRRPSRARSLVVTVFGDSVEPHGGSIWIGSLARLLAPLGINERSVRTSVFRLTREHWLEALEGTAGRRSFYRMTRAGRLRAAHAHHRIYGEQPRDWDGGWTLALLDVEAPEALAQDLDWEGFGRVAPRLHAHPAPDTHALQDIIDEHAAGAQVTVFRANAVESDGIESSRSLVRRGWPLAELSRHYADFLATFRDLAALLNSGRASDEQQFLLRTLLIHEFRRAQLRDPRLPDRLMPPDWPGSAARDLCRRLYFALTPGAERHLTGVAESADGPLRPAAPYFFERFGGAPATMPNG